VAALSFVTSPSRRAKRKASPSLTTIICVAALAGGAAYVFLPAGAAFDVGNIGWIKSHIPSLPSPPSPSPPPSSPPAQAVAVAARPQGHKSSDPAPATIAGTASVIDGDTLEIHDERIRLEGVDAPESHQRCKDADGKFWRCGQAAANGLDDLIAGNPVNCKTHGREKWGRLLATCTVRGESLQAWLVGHGYAVAYRQFSTAYVATEETAREARVGLWTGEFVMPSDWRKGQRLAGEKPTRAMIEGKFAAN
jgi:endonuclease YncB( thermonuclease family)